MKNADILVLDFGSQYTQLIARRLREQGVYTELVPFNASIDTIKAKNPKGIILSGGPASVYDENAYFCDDNLELWQHHLLVMILSHYAPYWTAYSWDMLWYAINRL